MRQTDEKILGALLTAGSIRGAAALLGSSQKTISDRLKKPEFAKRYSEAKAEQLQAVCAAITGTLCKAVETLQEIAENTDNIPTARTQAADALLRHALRYLEASEFERRLRALEELQERK